jgi:L-histidine N-alpha-methyltransferase
LIAIRSFRKERGEAITKRKVYEQILEGRIPYQFIYDDVGNLLYERLCESSEYYLARAEYQLLRRYFSDLKLDNVTIVDLGCGDGRKAVCSIESLLRRNVRYVGIDSSSPATEAAEIRLRSAFPDLDASFRVESIFSGIESIPDFRTQGPVVLCFLGSTIGNFSGQQRSDFFHLVRNHLVQRDRFMTGFDLIKPVSRLTAAYDDATGFAALAGLNMVCQINSLFGWDIPLSSFEHEASYNEEECMIETRLVATEKLSVSDENGEFRLEIEKGDYLITNCAHKFDLKSICSELQSVFSAKPSSLVHEEFGYALTEVVI